MRFDFFVLGNISREIFCSSSGISFGGGEYKSRVQV
jgi:hypothetical protein